MKVQFAEPELKSPARRQAPFAVVLVLVVLLTGALGALWALAI